MDDPKTAHCRLCADLKPHSKLVDLETDENRRPKVMEKLIRLSLGSILNDTDDTLSKTVCFPCLDSLDTAFNFVINVEASQSKLNAFITEQNFKQEVLDDLTCDSLDDNYENTDVKVELDTSTPEQDSSEPQDLELGTENVLNENVLNKNDDDENLLNESSIIKKEKDNGTDKTAILQSWKDYSWLCAYCGTVFPNIDELNQHSIEYHGCCNPYRCTDCNLRKLNLDKFIAHVKRHRKHLKLSCYKCHMTFSKHNEAIKHKKEHLATEFMCRGCNTTFATLKLSIEHSKFYKKDRKIHDIPDEHLTKDFSCVFCPKKFKNKGGLIQHLLIHSDRKRDHTCEICGKCFLNKTTLAEHKMLHDGSRPYKCEICKKGFRRLPQLRVHIGTHDTKKPFSCEKCGKMFRLRYQLNSHSIIHTDSLPFVCTYCEKRFRFKTILNQHIRQHTGIKPYECQICDKDFTNWPNYNKHMKRRHDMNMAKRKQTPEGLLPINSATGDVKLDPETNKTAEWKKQILDNSNRPGRPKLDKRKRVTKIKIVKDN